MKLGVCNKVMLLLLLLSRFSRVRLCDPLDSSPPDSPIPEILQARTLEGVAFAFSFNPLHPHVCQSLAAVLWWQWVVCSVEGNLEKAAGVRH